ncbi:MAG TPA: hypothetical protein VLA19_18640 [Herpetosiphonaceae bacterium]|nr:hypothetical protein [Herpetosiphonaceae bacterium]
MPRTPPTRAIVPTLDHRCLLCRTGLEPSDGQPVFLCPSCSIKWLNYRAAAEALTRRAQSQLGHPTSIFSKAEIGALYLYAESRARILANFYPYADQLRARLEWEEQQAQRKPQGRPRTQAHEWAREQVHAKGRVKRDVFEEWKQRYQAEIADVPADIDLHDLFKKVIKAAPATKRGGKKVGT